MSMYLAPTGATSETFPRQYSTAYINTPTSGTLYVSAIPLPKGLQINNLSLLIGAQLPRVLLMVGIRFLIVA